MLEPHIEPQKVLRYNNEQLLLEQRERIINRVITTAEYVAGLEDPESALASTTRQPALIYKRRTQYLDTIKD
jgi:hypothetical protein